MMWTNQAHKREYLLPKEILVKASLKEDCLDIFRSGVDAVDPYEAMKRYVRLCGEKLMVGDECVDLAQYQRISLIGAGKATASMALALEEILGDRLESGLIIVKYGHLQKLSQTTIIEAGHPVPDEAGFAGAQRLATQAESFSAGDLVFCLMSGGGSALLPYPVEGVSLPDKQETTRLLLESGATIHEINTVRKHLSRMKGGGLAKLVHPATLITLILSDVIGNNLDVIASGPTVGDSSSFEDCLTVLQRYDLIDRIPESVRDHIQQGAAGRREETPQPDDAIFKQTRNIIIGSNIQALEAAGQKAAELGYATCILSSFVEGETKEVARVHAAVLKEILSSGQPLAPPACVISGGETTVTIRGSGTGGRNMEFVLAAAGEIAGWKGGAVFSAGTDGNDGPTDAAGAYADWRTVERAAKLNLSTADYLKNNDSYHFFKHLDDLIVTGPTNTNVMDLRLVIVRPQA